MNFTKKPHIDPELLAVYHSFWLLSGNKVVCRRKELAKFAVDVCSEASLASRCVIFGYFNEAVYNYQ